MVRTKRNTGGIPAPAITVVAREPKTLLGWKDKFNETNWCQTRKENQTEEECIEEHSFKRHDAIKDVLWGYDSKSIMSDDLIHEDFTMASFGKFFYVNVSKTMIPTDNVRLSLALSDKFVYVIFIHDPDFFEINHQPTFPAYNIQDQYQLASLYGAARWVSSWCGGVAHSHQDTTTIENCNKHA